MTTPRPAPPGRHAPRTCVVAVDGTDASVHALVWGLRHATDQDMDVEVLTIWPPHHSVLIHEVPGHFCAARWSARAAQEGVIRQAVDRVPDAPITAVTLDNADVASAIVRASARHDLLILGSNSPDGPHRLTDRIIKGALSDVVVVESRNPTDVCSGPTVGEEGPPAVREEVPRS